MFGFKAFKIIMQRRSIQHGWGKCPLSKEERGDIILVLSKDEEKMLVYRPRLIQNRSKAATLCFMEVYPTIQCFGKVSFTSLNVSLQTSSFHVHESLLFQYCTLSGLEKCPFSFVEDMSFVIFIP